MTPRLLVASLLLALVACGPPQEQPAVPAAPRNVTATAGNMTATVSWDEPASDGGSAITGYQITGDGVLSVSAGAGDRTIVVTGLTNGVTYTFFVAAQNAVGWGPPASSLQVTPVAAPGVPGAPTGVVAQPANASAVVNWVAPADQGTSAVTSYRVVASPGGASAQATAPATTATVTGLTNGTAYTFIVMATSAAGEGPPSAPSASVSPFSAPAGSRLPYKGVPPSSSYTSTVMQADGNSLSNSASTLAAGGYVLTGAAYDTSSYILMGIKPSGGSATFAAQINQVASGYVPSTVASMGASGYLVTAVVYNASVFTLFGTKLSDTTYDTRVDQVPGSAVGSTVSANAAAGYVTTAMEYNVAGYTLISVKDNADPRTWTSLVQQIPDGSTLGSTATNMTRAGFAVIAIVSNTVGYTLVGLKESGGQTATDGAVDQVTGSGALDGSVSNRAGAGYVTLAMYYRSANYTLVSSR